LDIEKKRNKKIQKLKELDKSLRIKGVDLNLPEFY